MWGLGRGLGQSRKGRVWEDSYCQKTTKARGNTECTKYVGHTEFNVVAAYNYTHVHALYIRNWHTASVCMHGRINLAIWRIKVELVCQN